MPALKDLEQDVEDIGVPSWPLERGRSDDQNSTERGERSISRRQRHAVRLGEAQQVRVGRIVPGLSSNRYFMENRPGWRARVPW